MKNKNSTDRERFDRMRKAMRWSWKDIDHLTGRKNASSNIAKGVPAWSKLAIEVFESYELLVHRHFLKLIQLTVGEGWNISSIDDRHFIFTKNGYQREDEWLRVHFTPGTIVVTCKSDRIYVIVEGVQELFPAVEDVRIIEGVHSVRVPIAFEE